MSDAKRPSIAVELQKLVSEWPLDVIKHQNDDNRKVFSFPFLSLFTIFTVRTLSSRE